MTNKVKEEFCVIIYPDRDGRAAFRRIEMTQMSPPQYNLEECFGPNATEDFVFDTPKDYYAGYFNLRNTHRGTLHERTFVPTAEDPRLFWQVLEDLQLRAPEAAIFFQELSAKLLEQDTKIVRQNTPKEI